MAGPNRADSPLLLLVAPLALALAPEVAGLAGPPPGAAVGSPTVLAALSAPVGSEWLALVLAYLLGSVPFGWLLARLKGVDLRRVGSGNIGATNTGRALGRPLGILAFVLDFGKGYAPVAWIAPAFAASGVAGLGSEHAASLAALAGAASAVGHCSPITLGFRGGKAVATWCGAVVAADPIVFLIGGAVWLLLLFTVRFVGLASMGMALTFAVAFGWRSGTGDPWTFVAAAMTVLIAIRHRANIARMATGSEPRFGRGGRKAHG